MRRTRKFGIIGMVAVVIALVVISSIFTTFNDHTYVATVTDKERVTEVKDEGDNKNKVNSYYLIFCKDDAGNYYEFKNEDIWIRGKFRSSTVYNQLEVGETYKFTVVGLRVGIFSWYENIVKVEKVD